MWESDSFDYSSVTSSSESDLSDFSSSNQYGMKSTLPSKYRLGDNYTEHRDMAAQRVLARLTSNTQLRNPERHPSSSGYERTSGWNIPMTSESPTWSKRATAKEDLDQVAKYLVLLKKKIYEKNSCQAYPSGQLPKITSVNMVQYKNSQLHPRDQHDEPPAPKTKTSALPPIRTSSSHHAIKNQNATPNKHLKELSQPNTTAAEALSLLGKEDWENKIQGIDTIVSLISCHTEAALPSIRELRTAVIKEVTNLRSAVSLAAIKCLDTMFSAVQTHMDYNLQQTVSVLLNKAGDSSSFIREAVNSSLTSMVENVSPGHALTALIEGGLCHKNTTVRSTTVKHLAGLVDRMGPEFFLSGRKGITDRAIPAVAKAVQDRCQQARMYGRNILGMLAEHPRLEAMLTKYLPTKDLQALKLQLKKLPH